MDTNVSGFEFVSIRGLTSDQSIVQVFVVKGDQLLEVTRIGFLDGRKVSISGDTFFNTNRLFWPSNQGMVVLFQKDVAK